MDIIDNRALLVRTRNPQRITDAIAKSEVVGEEDGVHQVLVKWDMQEASALSKLMKNVPSPMGVEYEWPGMYTPFAHQKVTAEFLSLRHRAFCFNEQGTGKTASAIWAADYLMNKGLVKRVLIVCPLSIMKSAWMADLFKFAVHRSCDVAYGTRSQREEVIRGKTEFVVINHDGVGTVKNVLMAQKWFDLIIIDEANAYKNVQTVRWKTLRDVLVFKPMVWMMTGTPAAQSPVDAYGLAKIINPDILPKFFGQFRDMVLTKVSQFKWVVRPQSEQVIHRALQPAIRFEKKDCLDLPPVTYVDRDAPLTPQQVKFYNQLKARMSMVADGEEVTAINAAVNMSKLLQISGGAVYSDSGETILFDVSNRLAAVEEVINEATQKVLVFVPFKHTLKLLQEHLNKAHITSEIINGEVSLNNRSAIFDDFQTKTNPKVLLIQPQAASHGLTLTAASTIVWYAPVTSVETYLQANARIDRPGQKHPMTVIHISGSEVETRLYSMLQNRISIHGKLIELYREIVSNNP